MTKLSKLLDARIPLLPTCSHYNELLGVAAKEFGITRQKARDLYGLYTYKEWFDLLAKTRQKSR